MKKIILGICLFFMALGLQAQGLKQISVEKYYVANAADHAKDTNLPIGAVTYRFYAELDPGYFFIEAYGWPEHTLTFSTSTKFFNSASGNWRADLISAGNLPNSTVMLDSWLATGVVSDNPYYGVPKSEDDGVNTIVNIDGILQNADASAGLPLTSRDGLKELGGTDVVYDFAANGIGTTLQNAFKNNTSSSFVIGAASATQWYSTMRPQGATASNKVLIAQITTDGILHYELNVHIGKLVAGDVIESYYAYTNPIPVAGTSYTEITGTQYKLSADLGAPVSLPTASITAPVAGAVYTEPGVVTINANAVAGSSAIQKVEFLVDGVKVGEDASAPYSFAWTSVAKTGTTNLTVRAVDTDGNTGAASVAVGITVNGNAAPVVSALTATPAAIYRGTVVTLKATATDDVAVSTVTISVDGGAPVAATKAGNDYSIVYNVPANATKGSHTWSVVATDGGTPAKSTTVAGAFTVSNQAPVVAITSPAAAGFSIISGRDTVLVATATDADGDALSVSFFEAGNPTALATVNAAPYQFTYNASATGAKSITAVANDGTVSATSAAFNFSVVAPSGKDYELGTLSLLCSAADNFCLPIKATKAIINKTGYDITLIFDKAKVAPTGILTVAEGANAFVADRDFVSYSAHTYPGTDSIKFSIYLNSTVPAGTFFAAHAAGDVLACVEFSRLPAFGSKSSASFSTRVLQESTLTGYVMNGATNGSVSIVKEKDFAGSLSFWSDNSPIAYTNGVNLITNIFGDKNPSVKVQPDAAGNFVYDITNGTNMTISRDIPNSVRMDTIQQVISGLDAYYAAKVTVDDASYKPNVYQLIAMDVNRDGRVTAGDITQMQQRSVLNIGEYTQAGGTNLDWVFVPSQDVLTKDSYRISPNYPYVGSYGYYKNAVPVVPVVKNLVASQNVVYNINGADTCTTIKGENYKGIFLGDVTGNYSSMPSSQRLKSAKVNAGKFLFDIRNRGNNEYEIVISTENVDVINGYDVNLESSKFAEIVTANDYAKMNMARNLVNNQLGVTGYNLGSFNNGVLASVVLKAKSSIDASDIKVNLSSINEKNINYEMSASDVTGISDLSEAGVSVYPNPTHDVLKVAVVEKSTIQVVDVNGKVVIEVAANANEVKELDVNGLAKGMYVVKVVSDKKTILSKVIVQ